MAPNGPDAVALYIGSASDFPNGTVATTTRLQDAIVYGTDDPNASGLLPLLNASQPVANENATGNSQAQSNQRCPNGMGGFRRCQEADERSGSVLILRTRGNSG